MFSHKCTPIFSIQINLLLAIYLLNYNYRLCQAE
nr:MAG TPA: hypothetical protein [Caudoviricetes sp.]